MNNWSLETLRTIVQKQRDYIKEQNKVIDILKDEVNLLKQDMNKCLIKSESLDRQIKELYERVEKLESR
jgi:archaellum component FlaC